MLKKNTFSSRSDTQLTYFLDINDARQLGIYAAKSGDNIVLDFLLNPLQQNKITHTQQSYCNYLAKRDMLNRKKMIREKQRDLIEQFFSFYQDTILNYKEDLEAALKSELHDFFYQLRLKNRKQLSTKNEVIVKNEIIPLNLQLRTTLHKHFSEQVAEEFKSMQISLDMIFSLPDASSAYSQLLNDITNIEHALEQLQKESRACILAAHQQERCNEEMIKAHLRKKYDILHSIRINSKKILSLEKIKAFEEKINLELDLNFIDSKTGNNLLHFALKAGNFETAYFLINKGIDCHTVNYKHIIAIDTQASSSGNSLLHYLVNQQKYEAACELITKGASCKLTDSKNKTAIDIIKEGQSLLHFLIAKMNSSRDAFYQKVLLHLISTRFSLAHLLIKNQYEQSLYHLILTLPDQQIKLSIIKEIKQHILTQPLLSQLQQNINFDLLQHFNWLTERADTAWITRKWQGVNDEYILVHLTFLSHLQKKINIASKKGDDFLAEFLRKTLPNLSLKKPILSYYKIHLDLYSELRLQGHVASSVKSADIPKNSSTKQVTVFFSEPSSKKTTSCIDPMHWFSRPLTRLR